MKGLDKMNKKELQTQYNQTVEEYNKANNAFNIQLGKLVTLDKLTKEIKAPNEELKNFITEEIKEAQKLQKQALKQIEKHWHKILELDEQLFQTVEKVRAGK